MARRSIKWNRWFTIAAEVAGLAISFYLLLISMRVLYPEQVPCPRSKWFHCQSVLRGEWSHVGPFPVAGLGVVYFLIQLALSIALNKFRRGWAWLKLLVVFCGLLFVAWLRAVEFVWLKGICPWCWAVAGCVLMEAIFVYPLGVPPFPKLRLPARVGTVVGVVVVLIAICTGGAWWLLQREKEALRRELAVAQATPSPTPTPQRTPKIENPREKPSPTPRPNPSRSNSPQQGSVEEGVLPTQEVKLLAKHGWTVVASTESVENYLGKEEPVLLLVFDPQCEECQAFIRGGLETDELAKLPVKLVAVEQSSFYGPLSREVKNVPTLLLVDQDRKIRFKHEGRMSTSALVREIENALGS
ncbi:MAG: hypothetical protein N2644_10625 [Candidatus Sumerlaea chitinivorans]|jgi:uncharacterized membrane protein|nr:hypothetical protein [Candidatus Sumerlaea chitinivorans]